MSTIEIDDWKKAERIKAFNNKALEQGLRPESFIDNRKLWVPIHELECESETPDNTPTTAQVSSTTIKGLHGELSLSKGSRKFPIFGDTYANTPLVDQKLEDKVFYRSAVTEVPMWGHRDKMGRIPCVKMNTPMMLPSDC
jgi:hypothetical protein